MIAQKNLYRQGKRAVSYILLTMLLVIYFITAGTVQVQAQEKRIVRVAAWERGGRFDQEDGELVGYDADLLAKLSDITGFEFCYVWVSGPAEALEKLDAGELDLITAMRVTAERQQKYLYGGLAMGTTYSGLITRADRAELEYGDSDTIAQLRIGYEGKSGSRGEVLNYLQGIIGATDLVPYDSIAELREALRAGEIDAMATGANNLSEGERLIDKFAPQEVFFLSSRQEAELMRDMDNALANLMINYPDFLNELQTTYFPMYVESQITKEERLYLEACGTLIVGVPMKRCPVSYYDEKTGQFQGIVIELLDMLAKELNITFQYEGIPEGMSVAQALADERYDLVAPTFNWGNHTEVVPAYISEGLCDTSIALAGYDGKKLAADGKWNIGVVKEVSGIADVMIRNYPNCTIFQYDTQEEVLEALRSGEVDAQVNNVFIWIYLLQMPDYEDINIIPNVSQLLSYCISGAKSHTDTELMNIINKGITMLSDSDIDSMTVQYTGAKLYQYSIWDYLEKYRVMIILGICFMIVIITVMILFNSTRSRFINRLTEQNRQLTAANSAKSDFLSRMSHDIRTPMNAIIGMTAIAKENNRDQEVGGFLDKIDSASHFLLGLINDILDITRIESGKMELHEEAYSLGEFYAEMQTIIGLLVREKDQKLSCHLEDENLRFRVDKLRFQQIFFNILSNAIKYTPKGGTIFFNNKNEKVDQNIMKMVFCVQDTGIGMSQEFLEKAFLPFEQENAKTVSEWQGTGLGLPIVKRIVDAMGGQIEIQSQRGEGTVVTITLFLMLEENETEEGQSIAQNQVETAEVQGSEKKCTYPVLQGKRALLVEDNQVNIMVVQRLLQHVGMLTECAENGQLGVDMFRESSPGYYDVVLMDIRMPVMDGIEAGKQIRRLKHADAEKIPIIAMTANAFDEDRKQTKEVGMNAHLSKPIEPKLLYSTLEEFISGDRTIPESSESE